MRTGWAGTTAECVGGEYRTGGGGVAGGMCGVGQHVAAAGPSDRHGDADIYEYGCRDEYRTANQDTTPEADEYAAAARDAHADAHAAANADVNAWHGDGQDHRSKWQLGVHASGRNHQARYDGRMDERERCPAYLNQRHWRVGLEEYFGHDGHIRIHLHWCRHLHVSLQLPLLHDRPDHGELVSEREVSRIHLRQRLC
jgi:hypothetical protein